MKPAKAQFEDFVAIRDSGVTNMWNIKLVCELSCSGLTQDICLYIMKHFDELAEEYDIDV